MGAFQKYCQENVTGDEGKGDNGSDSNSDKEGVAIWKGLCKKPKVNLENNNYGEPQLLKDCLRTAGDKNKDLD